MTTVVLVVVAIAIVPVVVWVTLEIMSEASTVHSFSRSEGMHFKD